MPIFFIGWLPVAFMAMLMYSLVNKISEVSERRQKSRILQSPLGIRIRQYEEVISAYSAALEEAKRAGFEAQRVVERKRLEAERPKKVAERAERRKRLDHWASLRGIRFERALAALFRNLGYQVRFTPVSGYQGIDLILTKDGKTTIVQCKGQKGPASPAVVRELFGSLHAFEGANHAILACTGGFTQGVKDFARGKRITLISAIEMAKMARGVSQS